MMITKRIEQLPQCFQKCMVWKIICTKKQVNLVLIGAKLVHKFVQGWDIPSMTSFLKFCEQKTMCGIWPLSCKNVMR